MNEKITMRMTHFHSKENITIKQGMEQFVREKKANNLSEDSIKNYEYVFKLFCRSILEDKLCQQISTEDFLIFIEKTKENNPNISDKSIETYMRNLRVIFYYFMEKEYTPLFKIKMPKYVENEKDPFTDDEVSRLKKRPDMKTCEFHYYRNWVIACFFLGSGIRQRTLINIKIEDLDFENEFIRLKAVKNKKTYKIPMSSALKDILIDYLKYRRGNPDDYLFCTERGEKLTNAGVKSAMIRYSRSRGVSKNGTHVYRHTFAKYFVLGGGTLPELQEVLGHCSVEMANRYIKLYGEDLKRDFQKRNALDVNSEDIDGRQFIKMKKR